MIASIYDQVFFPYLVPGLFGGVGLVVWGAFQEKLMDRLIALLVGILPIWGGLVFGVAAGFVALVSRGELPLHGFFGD